MPLPVTWFAHREVVRERHEADPRRPYVVFHGQCDSGEAPCFYGVADQPDGPVAKGSRRGEQHDVYLVFHEFAGDFGGRAVHQRGRVVDGSHEGEVARRQTAHQSVFDQSAQGLKRKDGVKVAALVRPVVGVGPREIVGTGRDLPVGAVTGWVVDIEARLLG